MTKKKKKNEPSRFGSSRKFDIQLINYDTAWITTQRQRKILY